MNKFYLLSVAVGFFSLAHAQTDYVVPTTIEDAYIQKINPNGTVVAGQDSFGTTTFGHHVKSGITFEYPATAPGDGNCISNDGIIVGMTLGSKQMGCLMKNGSAMVPSSLSSIDMSQFNAITPDGSRACGWVINKSGVGALFTAFYCDITPSGSVGRPILLPAPDKDFFQGTPQYCNAINISDDGKVITGLMTDLYGSYAWPIIFTEDDEGNWSYSLPTESFFNPDNRPLPSMGELGEPPVKPEPVDFMTPENRAEYEELLKENPNATPWGFMDDDEYNAYLQAGYKYSDDYYEYTRQEERFENEMRRLGSDLRFGGFATLSPDGKTFIAEKTPTNIDRQAGFTSSGLVHYVFDTATGEFTRLQTKENNLIITQMLSDGTLIAVTNPMSFFPYVGYIKLPDMDDFIPWLDYIDYTIPSYLPWLEDNLGMYGVVGYEPNGDPIYGEYIITGLLAFSDDMKVVSGGIYSQEGPAALSYVYSGDDNESSAVEEILPEATEEEEFDVYNINGIRVLTTRDRNAVDNLPKGIYIINGKKIRI